MIYYKLQKAAFLAGSRSRFLCFCHLASASAGPEAVSTWSSCQLAAKSTVV